METLICVFCCFEMLLATGECEKIAAELAFKYALISPSGKLHSRWRDQSERAKNAELAILETDFIFYVPMQSPLAARYEFSGERKENIARAIRSAVSAPHTWD
jgi:hypothetical protein